MDDRIRKKSREFLRFRISALIDRVIEVESIPKDSETYADLGYVKLYAKELAKGDKDEKES
jgi:hypothetical protein